MNTWPRRALYAAGLSLSLSGAVSAALTEVDPGPYTLATGGYPMWYKDASELSLELCQSRATSSRAPGAPGAPAYMCTLLPEPGVYDDTLPLVFPDNWPPEMFWFLAETSIPAVGNSGYELEVYVAGIEAAFASENPVDGDQQSFARIRIRASVPTPGTYRITHPYGVETVVVNTPGRRAINITRDIGIGAPGDFSGALKGDIGPFLRSATGFYTELNPDTGATDTFIGDPNITEAVTGSPFNTNFVAIDGPAGHIQTDVFTLSGKVLDPRAQTPVNLERATYQRNGNGTRVEVFAKAPSDASLCMRYGLALVGTPGSPCEFTLLSDNNGLFFSQQLNQAAPPPVLVVTASSTTGGTRPTALSSKLSDVVKIRTAHFDWASKRLVIEASSSDEVLIPDLVAQGYGRLSKSGTLQTLTVTDLTQPPATVTVKSARGGSDVEPVTVVGNAPVVAENQPPLAQADVGGTSVGVPLTLNLLTNDTDPDGDMPLTITDLTQPGTGLGSVVLNGTTSVTYTPPVGATTAFPAIFGYRAQDAKGLKSEPATVTVNVVPNRAPTAVADSVATLGVPLTINVLANDTDPEGNLPLAVASVTQPPVGRGTVSHNGTTVTYTPPATVTAPFTTTFTYVVRDSIGALSGNGTVTVQVSPKPPTETLTVTAATVTARSNNRYNWDISGTSSVTTGNTVTVQVTTRNGLVTLGSTAVPLTGRWRVIVSNSTTLVPTATPSATIRTSQGTVRTVPVRLQ
ncbi:Ig-like domain-containing protein [Pseudomonas guariconensis]|uniref:Ig-like domain-containing protein n=1 Tax=Pseudomonas guariconensis TaxID=1288410 RepID=UPI0025A95C76|nr:Ig-like domain-containing protein [Pseudomonas guariconensis]MDM9593979.1 Ig-like domain-containing protein [Pseudomonas guariconensis]MDM9606806.1 Ig-like domain-containing protein [Pseudomonas guariconensis]MDM9611762.1 Ig-like domain-containing protein [Pseudomonas guariconensis]